MSKKRKSSSGLFLLIAVATLGAAGYGFGPGKWFESKEDIGVEGVEVRRGPLRISVIESGNLEAKDAKRLKCELEGRPTILYLIPEGTRVTEGTLVAELDASELIDGRVAQEIDVQNAEAAFTKARENYEIQALQNESDIAAAQQALEFAEADKRKYVEGDWPQQLREADEAIVLAEEEMKRAEDRLKWSKELEEKGFLQRTELEGDKLSFERSKILAEQAKRRRELLIDFDNPKEARRLAADIEEAERELKRTQLQAKSRLVDYESDKRTAKSKLDLEVETLAKMNDQIDKARILAPVDGMVVYGRQDGGRWSRGDPIAEGTQVRERQEIIRIPTAQGMTAEVSIHESVLKQVQVGQPCKITVDAIPGREYSGEVSFVALLPDKNSWWANPDLRVYRSEMTLFDADDEMRPGMSCSIEILIEDIEDTLYVPLQCVMPHGGRTIAFVAKNGEIESRDVEVGLDNSKWVQILSGLEEGEVVLLSPPEGFEPDASEAEDGDAPKSFESGGMRPGGGAGSGAGSSGGGNRGGRSGAPAANYRGGGASGSKSSGMSPGGPASARRGDGSKRSGEGGRPQGGSSDGRPGGGERPSSTDRSQ